MKNQFTLEVKNPCSENFNNFTATKAGGFCKSCSKEVIDFTGKSPQEIIEYFKKQTNEKTCGRFTDYQLTTYTENSNPKKKNFLKSVGLACLSLFAFNTVEAQETKPKTEILENQKNDTITTKNNRIIIKGTVSDQLEVLPGASVVLQGSTIGTETDFDGNFEFPKPLKKGDVLVFSFVGFESKKIVINDEKSASNVTLKNLITSCDLIFLGEVNVKKIYKSKRKFTKK
ncbi:carboxypeptidase-like regulatory domain-containing protein [Tenacibaculum agarivorans]|uniref:carboxypeptidase-like regulatory domain-containing protein n=1 Tax=Tenacibaculum agarivorans TaxID=1908389 RepID=UPI00094B7C28|nr:carboxypeptidase-like regulatory domain-containing protein [Tenacibaculum agarivorans]